MDTPVVVTFSSSVLVNGSGPTSRFSSFTLGGQMDEALETLVGVPGGRQPCQLGFRGRGLAAKYDDIEAVTCIGVIAGAPRTNMAQLVEAVVAQGELVTINLTTPDGTSRTASGIVTNLVPSFGPTGVVQRFDVVFHRCDRLRYTNQSTFLDASAPGS